jgi:catechol 2,3-dioxygenase-like lactoylglutathione lyase family enzyme
MIFYGHRSWEILPMRYVQGLDHVVILARDLDDAERRFAGLGFSPTPRGFHPAQMGTANTTVVFDDDTYFELLGVVRPTGHNLATRQALEAGEGPAGIAFKTEDARAAAREFATSSLADGDAVDFVRPVELPQGRQDAMFTIARLVPAATPGAMSFVCQHHTPEAVWRQDHLAQPNGSTGVLEVVGVTADLSAVAQAWARVLGDRVRRTPTSIAIDAGSAAITFLTPEALSGRFGDQAPEVDREPRLVGLRLRIGSTEQLRRHLADAGVPHATAAAGSILVPPGEACGTLLEFAEV